MNFLESEMTQRHCREEEHTEWIKEPNGKLLVTLKDSLWLPGREKSKGEAEDPREMEANMIN